MNDFGANPFGLLTFIVAPAILTNASSIMALGTSNRFARAIDRARELSSQIERQTASDPHSAPRIQKLRYARQRSQLLVRALTAFYVSVGAFAAASLISLLGAVFFVSHFELLHEVTQGIALSAGVVGVAGLTAGSTLLVWETRLVVRILREETDQMVNDFNGR